MRRSFLLPALASLALSAACSPATQGDAPASAAPADYSPAIADSRRPAADTERDALRLPKQVLEFTQVKKGDIVGDYLMGSGYWTRMLAPAVGETGKIYGFTADEFVAFRPAYADEQDAVIKDYDNVLKVRSPIAAPAFPEPLDLLLTVQNFHDLFIEQMPNGTGAKAVKAFYDALKPGGTLVVIDHSAPDGSGTSRTSELHRIDRQFVIDTLTAAGFVLDGSADFYARPDDPRDANVFAPTIRGKTDQFALRFRKPI
ncbi:class I SAM-dependent methyltransferase [Croceibacterium aestuarii]|uniref:class I SAM-dependent methyltransferase n=1 Tax=Croceibacterium aestuarii TaxID=3064139 RepID=UPI00272DEB58|nr:methyltransferase [Croceibacterium sp. D39]